MSCPPFNGLFLARPGDPDYLTQRCLESMISMPTIMEEADALEGAKFNSPEEKSCGRIEAARLLQLALCLERYLASWITEIQETGIEPPSSSGTITLQAQPPLHFAPRHLHYTNSEAADLWAFFWSISIHLHELIGQIRPRYAALSEASPAAYPPLSPELARAGKDRATLNEYAENICGTAFTGLRSCPFTVHATTVALYTAQWYYKRQGVHEKLRWCTEAVRVLQPDEVAGGSTREHSGRRWSPIVVYDLPSEVD